MDGLKIKKESLRILQKKIWSFCNEIELKKDRQLLYILNWQPCQCNLSADPVSVLHLWDNAESIEFFIEDQDFSAPYDLAPPQPHLSQQQVVSLSQSSCTSPV